MSLPKIKEILDLNFSNEKLSLEIVRIKKELFDLRLKKATRQSFKPHFFKHKQHKIAQLLMVQNLEKKSNKLYINYLHIRSNNVPENLNIKSTFLNKG